MTSPYTNNTMSISNNHNSKFNTMQSITSSATTNFTNSNTSSTANSPLLVSSEPQNINLQQPMGIVDKYVILSELGQDHLYPVYLAAPIFETASPNNSNLVVLKAIPAADFRKSFENELNIFQLKPHKNLLQCIEIIKNARFFFSNPQVRTSENRKPLPTEGFYHILVLKYQANGDFLDFVKKRKLDERVTRYYFAQLLDALEHMHSNGYCHRDLKIENILVDQNYDLVLTDFGHSIKYRDHNGEKVFIGDSSITTPGICPPEFHRGFGYRGIPMDIFALGKLLLIFVTGFNPFKSAKEADQNYVLILKGQWPAYWKLTATWMKKKWMKAETFSKELRALLEAMLNPEPSKRPSIQQIRESAWFKKTQPASSEEVRMAMMRAKSQN
eukprot:CAMPEP_0176420880 /NCGR_PEP_ID=MMETSP0127-20121128/8853_1 /TAXON_ID=938130 /ORGANISM="Platyophrya macrostoma, Strain WH" /LENGTH=385 /DNA_ID=CAMNT_0017801527 /DNA_START=204 /DNA_END=1361 /DNA_ORIENTATION=+